MSSFGTRLRAQRERQQVTLEDVAEQTKIKASLLAALERDDVSHWPSGIFRRSYIRSYAHAIGLDADAVVREFLALYPDPNDEIAGGLDAALAGETTRRRPPIRLRFLIESAIEALPVRRASAPQNKSAGKPPWAGAAHRVAEDSGAFATAQPEPSIVEADDWTTEKSVASLAQVDEQLPLPGVPTPTIAREGAVPVGSRDQLTELAALCARMARMADAAELESVFDGAATILDAMGVILWTWDTQAGVLRPGFAHGYPNHILARLGAVAPDADNAIAAAFRTAETRVVQGGAEATGAIVVPLIAAVGCTGVLAFELRDGGEQSDSVKACAAIIAAQLATLIG